MHVTESNDDISSFKLLYFKLMYLGSSGSVQAAIARTASRSLALYFARPVRLFRPAKVNGWQTLKNLAKQQGEALGPQYLLSLIKLHGVTVLPKHFIPPMFVNAILGFVLWESYGVASSGLDPYVSTHSLANAAVSGAVAGTCQAVVAAPAENVRLILEGGFRGHSWFSAWKEVFRERGPSPTITAKGQQIREIRELRNWFQEVGQMAGRGWEGWGWGCAKDAIGFATFFFIFEISRRAGIRGKKLVEDRLEVAGRLPAIVNGITLVSGGVFAGLAYEFTCRPFDITRRVIHLERPEPPYKILQRRFMKDGVQLFFQSSFLPHTVERQTMLRTIARVGHGELVFLFGKPMDLQDICKPIAYSWVRTIGFF